MSQIVKSFIGYFLLLVVVFAGTGIVSVSIDATNAQRYVSDITDEMEMYNFSDTIVSECTDRVNNHTDRQAKNYSNLTINNLANAGDPYSNGREVTMEYKFTIPFLNIGSTTHVVRAVAR
ncbi:MAG: hypothetical protein ACI4FX_02995 [Agathobacter sp.]